MSNRKYPRLSDGYHERSPFHPYQTSSKHTGKNHSNCIADGSRERDRSPANSTGFSSRDNSPYSSSNRHSNNSSPRTHRSKYNTHRPKDKRGSSQSPNDTSSSSARERQSRFNHVSNNEEFPWSQHVSSSGKTYYYNFKTEKSQWEKPKEWIERERREKEKIRQKQLTTSESKDREAGKEHVIGRDNNYGKPNKYGLSKLATKELHGSDRYDVSRMYAEDRTKDNHHPSSTDKPLSVVKTSSAYTAAVSTASQRSTPVAANSSVSPAGSLQDVSPPSTPSSRSSMFETRPHNASPQLISVSPHITQYNTTQSPHLQQQQQQQHASGYGVYPATTQGASVPHFTSTQQYNMQQSSYSQYGLVNNGNQLHTPPTQTAAGQPSHRTSNDVPTQPALHPLQQAMLLHQRQLSENKRSTSGLPHQYSSVSSVSGHVQMSTSTLLKEESRVHSQPGSPIVFSHASSLTTSTTAKEHYPALAPLYTSLSAHRQSPSPSALASQPSPTVNLQALTKYVDKSLTGHVAGWVTEGAEKQIQRLSEEGSMNGSDANRIVIEQLHCHSQLNLLELRLNVGTKRISSLKGLTKTLEHLLAESDKKSLT